jgi:hypothetical protein
MGKHAVLTALLALSVVDTFPEEGKDKLLSLLATNINNYDREMKNYVVYILQEFDRTTQTDKKRDGVPNGCTSLGANGGVRLDLRSLSSGALHCLWILDRMTVKLNLE